MENWYPLIGLLVIFLIVFGLYELWRYFKQIERRLTWLEQQEHKKQNQEEG